MPAHNFIILSLQIGWTGPLLFPLLKKREGRLRGADLSNKYVIETKIQT